MNWLSIHLASGASLFSGSGLLLVGMLLATKSRGKGRFFSKLISSIGAALIFLSSTPFPLWLYFTFTFFLFGLIACMAGTHFRSFPKKFVPIFGGLLVGCDLIMIAVELPHQKPGHLPNQSYSQLYLIGDSISSGINEDPNWPEVFRERYRIGIKNLARPGATLASALKQSELVPAEDCLVLLEIGGNDLLSNAHSRDFADDLRALFEAVKKPGRTILMFELPLLPGQAALGRVQRSMAGEYGIILIPKRYFCRVLGAPNATIDGLHLSPIGTSMMADMVRASLGQLQGRGF